MRILYVSYDDLSGSYAWTVHVAAIANRLAAKGHELHLLHPEGPASPEIRVERWPLTRPRNFLLKLFWLLLGSFLELLYYRIKLKPDLFYVRGIHPTLAPAFAGLFKPVVYEVNGLLEYETTSWLRRIVIWISHWISLKLARAVVTVSPLLKQGLVERYGARADKVRVVPNGADCARFHPADRMEVRRRLGLPEDAKIALFVGSFYEHHGLDLLLEAAPILRERVPEAMFLLVGDGRTRASVQGRARERGLGPVFRFTGEIPHDRVPEYVAAADACLYLLRHTYNGRFGFSPIKVYEYMACGRPVVAATNHAEILEFVNGNGVGIAESLEPRLIADALVKVFADPERYGRRGRELAEATYNWDRAAADVDGLLRTI